MATPKLTQGDVNFLWKLFQARESQIEANIKFNPQNSQVLRETQAKERRQFLNLISLLTNL
jgi:hypothetical protein